MSKRGTASLSLSSRCGPFFSHRLFYKSKLVLGIGCHSVPTTTLSSADKGIVGLNSFFQSFSEPNSVLVRVLPLPATMTGNQIHMIILINYILPSTNNGDIRSSFVFMLRASARLRIESLFVRPSLAFASDICTAIIKLF